MKYLVLAYGAEEDWNRLTSKEQEALLAQDEILRERGSLVAAVEQAVTTVTAWDRIPATTSDPFSHLTRPLAGFGVIEADSREEAIALVANTPCARAKGAVEIRAIIGMNAGAPVVA